MPRIEGDFSTISSSFEALPDGDYRFKLMDIEEQEKVSGKNAALIFKSEVQEGEKKGRQFFDYVYLTTNEGKANAIGLGRIKAYAEAILGDEAANNPSGIDTDELKGGVFDGIIKARTYEAKDGSGQKTSADLKKVMRVA